MAKKTLTELTDTSGRKNIIVEDLPDIFNKYIIDKAENLASSINVYPPREPNAYNTMEYSSKIFEFHIVSEAKVKEVID